MSTLLRLFIKVYSDGCPTFEVTAAPEVLNYLFPQIPHPGCMPCPFAIQLIPTNEQERVADLSSVLNTRQLRPNEDHYRILPSPHRLRELLASQPRVFPPPSAHPIHLRVARDDAPYFPLERDPELSHLPGYRRIWIQPADVSKYFESMGYKYIGSHVEACGACEPKEIWDIHTFVGGEKLKTLFGIMTLSTLQEDVEESIGTPRNGSRVTFHEDDLIKM